MPPVMRTPFFFLSEHVEDRRCGYDSAFSGSCGYDFAFSEEIVAWIIRATLRYSVRGYQKHSLYLPSDTEGCAGGFIFCPQTAVMPAITILMGVHPISFAYAHNEKSCPVTIDRRHRYEGVQIVDCIEYRWIPLTFLPFRVMYGHNNSEGGIAVVWSWSWV